MDGRIVYRGGVIVLAIVLAYLSLAITASNALATRLPDIALKIWPWNAAALARLSSNQIAENSSSLPAISAAAVQAGRALQREPLLAEAVRSMGIYEVAKNNIAGADRLFAYGERISKRDIPTQFWLIQRRVDAGDVAGALSHYGIVLNVAPSSSAQLFPILVSALDDPALQRPIATLVRDGSSWQSSFMYEVNKAPSIPGAASLYINLHAMGVEIDPGQLSAFLSRATQSGQPSLAGRVYSRLVDSQWSEKSLAGQLDGSFERRRDLAPFGWALEAGSAWRDKRPNANGNALYLAVSDDTQTPVASRWLMLPAGHYRLSGTVGRLDGNQAVNLRIDLNCTFGATENQHVSAPVSARHFAVEVSTSNCPSQTLSLHATGQVEGADGTIWVDDLQLVPASPNVQQ